MDATKTFELAFEQTFGLLKDLFLNFWLCKIFKNVFMKMTNLTGFDYFGDIFNWLVSCYGRISRLFRHFGIQAFFSSA